MIKKPTLILLVFAIALGLAVYYFDWKRSENAKPPADTSKPAFSLDASKISSFTLAHPAQKDDIPTRFEKRDGTWWIAQPIDTRADQSTAEGIVDQLAEDRVSQTEPGTEDRRKAYGLDPPQASIEFELPGGAKHTLLIGNKDFSGDSAYTIVDDAQKVSLLPASIAESAGKPLQQLRDRSFTLMRRIFSASRYMMRMAISSSPPPRAKPTNGRSIRLPLTKESSRRAGRCSIRSRASRRTT
jgi:Domain of unknown function (DUF4340)